MISLLCLRAGQDKTTPLLSSVEQRLRVSSIPNTWQSAAFLSVTCSSPSRGATRSLIPRCPRSTTFVSSRYRRRGIPCWTRSLSGSIRPSPVIRRRFRNVPTRHRFGIAQNSAAAEAPERGLGSRWQHPGYPSAPMNAAAEANDAAVRTWFQRFQRVR